MEIFDIKALQAFPFAERQKNVFFQANEFKMRIIELKKNEQLPDCQMSSHVIFLLLSGVVEVLVNNKKSLLNEGELLVSEPARFAMKAISPSRLVGIQIDKQEV